MIDTTGTVVTRTRTLVVSITDKVAPNDSQEGWGTSAMVIIVGQGFSRSPGGDRMRNGRISKQVARYAARCYGLDDVQAHALAMLVSEGWHETGPFIGNSGLRVRQCWADTIAPRIQDPGNLLPYETVYIDVLAEAS